MTLRRSALPTRRVFPLAAGAAIVAVLLLGAASHEAASHGAAAQSRPQAETAGPVAVLTAAHTPTSTSAPSGASGEGPPGIQVGPTNTTAPSTPAPGSGGSVSGGAQSSPGLFDITGHIEAAIDSWFRDVVTSALNPILDLLGHTLLATPNVTAQSRVGQLW